MASDLPADGSGHRGSLRLHGFASDDPAVGREIRTNFRQPDPAPLIRSAQRRMASRWSRHFDVRQEALATARRGPARFVLEVLVNSPPAVLPSVVLLQGICGSVLRRGRHPSLLPQFGYRVTHLISRNLRRVS